MTAELALSLDVIYHLVEDDTFDVYMTHLFSAATRFVVVYSSNYDDNGTAAHVRHRRFTDWVSQNAAEWTQKAKIDNPYPPVPGAQDETSAADFYVFARKAP